MTANLNTVSGKMHILKFPKGYWEILQYYSFSFQLIKSAFGSTQMVYCLGILKLNWAFPITLVSWFPENFIKATIHNSPHKSLIYNFRHNAKYVGRICTAEFMFAFSSCDFWNESTFSFKTWMMTFKIINIFKVNEVRTLFIH